MFILEIVEVTLVTTSLISIITIALKLTKLNIFQFLYETIPCSSDNLYDSLKFIADYFNWHQLLENTFLLDISGWGMLLYACLMADFACFMIFR